MNKNKSLSNSYKDAGVDITKGYKAVELMKEHIEKTSKYGITSAVGGFGGSIELDMTGIKKPVLVSGTDGVGTKLKLAFLMDKHDTVGIDCVAMCVNDIVCVGAKPVSFLDYIATGKLIPEKISDIVKGISDGCVQSMCPLVGGETAEMPGFYKGDEYDLAGFAVGIVDKDEIIDKNNVETKDKLIALPSSGVHSNGFSLVRKIFDIENADLSSYTEELNGLSLGETLLTPTKIYVKPILSLMKSLKIKSIAHITGGGFYENIPRSIPEGKGVSIEKGNIKTLPIFDLIAEKGNIPEHDMFNTFNMGVGMVVTVASSEAEKAIQILKSLGEDAYILGEVVDKEGVHIW